ncbi:mediator of RNA polymerase II transcription subunit [Wolffia australiana]
MAEKNPPLTTKRKRELGLEGQRHLEETISAAFQILAAMNEELCNSSLWLSSPAGAGHGAGNGEAYHDSGVHAGGALDEARLRYKTAVSSLRNVIAALSPSQEIGMGGNVAETVVDQDEVARLERRASDLRKELGMKNKHVKVLIGQLRELVADLSTWQSPISL